MEQISPPESQQAGASPDPHSTADHPPDGTTRQAALWATVVAVPLAVLVGIFAFARLSPDEPAADPTPPPTAPTAQSTAPVQMGAPPLAQRPATVCRALLSQLPPTLRDLAQRPVSAGPEQNAAYGDPPITVACGVPAPSYPATDDVWVVNGVCWHAGNEADTVVLTTVDREVPVRVSVPGAYEPPLQWVAPLSESVVAGVPSTKTRPAGCTG